jgi:predicted phosphoadenosine phosphosulfate sulfurtransferase
LGVEYLRVEIDWAGFTDAQIVAAFKAWLAENRPHGVGVASRRGQRKQKGYRDYLAWLGMMRLLNAHPFTSIKRAKPDAWLHYRSADWPRARKKAGGIFKWLFPFLPQQDLPIHYQTAGRRAK